MKTKVITIKDYEGLYRGSVFDGVLKKGMWCGIATERCGSFEVEVPAEYVEVWEEEKHDATYHARQYLAKQAAIRLEKEERAELARLKAKYEDVK